MSNRDTFHAQALAPLEHLVSLNLYRSSVSQTALLAILCNNRHLEDLNLSACPNIQGDEVLYALKTRCEYKEIFPDQPRCAWCSPVASLTSPASTSGAAPPSLPEE